MPMWAVQTASGEDEWVEADMLATESGALVALSLEGMLMRAWAPGRWQTARPVGGVDASPVDDGNEMAHVVIGLTQG